MNYFLKHEDLDFLNTLSNEDLNLLVEILIKDKKGNVRLTESLTTNEKYISYNPNHKLYVDLIINEIVLYGSNTFFIFNRKRKRL